MAQTRQSGSFRFSLILASTRRQTSVYSSVEEMPRELREECLDALRGEDAATIVIADSSGKRHIEQSAAAGPAPAVSSSHSHRIPWQLAVELLVFGASMLGLWVLATAR
jgi:hypothetical protein